MVFDTVEVREQILESASGIRESILNSGITESIVRTGRSVRERLSNAARKFILRPKEPKEVKPSGEWHELEASRVCDVVNPRAAYGPGYIPIFVGASTYYILTSQPPIQSANWFRNFSHWIRNGGIRDPSQYQEMLPHNLRTHVIWTMIYGLAGTTFASIYTPWTQWIAFVFLVIRYCQLLWPVSFIETGEDDEDNNPPVDRGGGAAEY